MSFALSSSFSFVVTSFLELARPFIMLNKEPTIPLAWLSSGFLSWGCGAISSMLLNDCSTVGCAR